MKIKMEFIIKKQVRRFIEQIKKEIHNLINLIKNKNSTTSVLMRLNKQLNAKNWKFLCCC